MMDLDPRLVAKINQALVSTGERERLKEVLRRKLDESGWTARVRQECDKEIKQMNAEHVSPQEVADRVAPLARKSVPDTVKVDMMNEIKRFLDANL